MLRRGPVLSTLLCAALAFLLSTAPAWAAPTGYVVDEDEELVTLGTVDLGAGAPTLTVIGDTGLAPSTTAIVGVALAPNGTIYALSSADDPTDTMYVLDAATGAVIDTIPLDIKLSGAQPVVTSNGTVYIASGTDLLEVNVATGVTTPRATLPSGASGAAARCIDAAGTNQIFVISPGAAEIHRVDLPSFAVSTLPQPPGVPLNSTKLAFDAAGTLWALNTNVVSPAVFTVDVTSGTGTSVGASVNNAPGVAIAPTTCPAAPPVNPPVNPPAVTPSFTG